MDTIAVTIPATGTCNVPEVFANNVQLLVASLDFARVWQERGTSQGYRMTAQELRQAAEAARTIAAQCEEFAQAADDASV